MNQSLFTVGRFENRNGVISWRVDGYLHGVRIRKNFKSREEAIAEKATLEINALQIEAGMQSAPTFLSEVQLREAETVFNRLKDSPRPLSFYLDFALANYREPETQKRLSAAIPIYTEAKDHEFQQDQISAPQLERIKRDLKRLLKHFPSVTVAELTAERLIGFFNLGKPKLKTYNNRRGIVSTFLKFSFQRGWLSENPMTKVPSHRIRRKREAISTFSAAKAEKLMRHVESLEGGRFVPYFALCLFAGIRPCLRTGEILRLKPELVNLEAGIINITAEVSKVREPRKITIQPNLAAWLKAYPLDKFPIIPANLQHVRAKIAKAFELSHDIMRHTFISMFVAKFRSIGEAAIQAGNSEAIIRKHYLDMKSQTEAEAFNAIMPKKTAGEQESKALPVAA
ncbi:tyrosine-type recombinase/integrase [Rariglobus hedericola]|uniref:Site-specific integrase n=1 Tax=Rariglobus hedericola TaxID=2597822 RepID=A0A556QPE4_9BACT|nr:site-specific integrase [Rariglobus hedericola]TSJ78518.1 site-specific integrase [Rariglobus hedericola]